jgi:hypothetical protein
MSPLVPGGFGRSFGRRGFLLALLAIAFLGLFWGEVILIKLFVVVPVPYFVVWYRMENLPEDLSVCPGTSIPQRLKLIGQRVCYDTVFCAAKVVLVRHPRGLAVCVPSLMVLYWDKAQLFQGQKMS